GLLDSLVLQTNNHLRFCMTWTFFLISFKLYLRSRPAKAAIDPLPPDSIALCLRLRHMFRSYYPDSWIVPLPVAVCAAGCCPFPAMPRLLRSRLLSRSPGLLRPGSGERPAPGYPLPCAP